MKRIDIRVLCLFLCIGTVQWYGLKAQIVLDENLRKETVIQIAKIMEEKYVLPDIGKKYSETILKKQDSGQYDHITDASELALKLIEDFNHIHEDKHLNIRYDPGLIQNIKRQSGMSESEREKSFERQKLEERRRNYGLTELKILPGNVGYFKLNEFPSSRGSETIISAMGFIQYTDAVILDLRENTGGNPEIIQLLGSYFFDEITYFSSIYNRLTDKTIQYKTLLYVPGKCMPDTKLYILTGEHTFSAAEAFAYDFMQLKRAIVVGGKTTGGAHPTNRFIVNDHYVIYVPFAQAINPITNSNWEGTGIEPDIQCKAEDALMVAYEMALDSIIYDNKDEYFINNLGYAILSSNMVELAIKVFIKNVGFFPDSFNVYDSLGEAYMKNGDTQMAIENYKKSLELNPSNDNAKKMLKQLEKK